MSAGYMRRCAGKQRYEAKSDAMNHRSALAGRAGIPVGKLHAYLCGQCLGWHVGGSGNFMKTRARRPGKRPNKRMRGR